MNSAHALDSARRRAGLLTPDEVAALAPDVLVLDPASVLVGRSVTVEPGVVLYPGTVLETRGASSVVVRSGARLGPGPIAVIADGARVEIGRAELGPGPVTVVAIGSASPSTGEGSSGAGSADVVIGDGARLSGGCLVEGPATIGAGAQVIGTVSVRDVVLGAGVDRHHPDPDRRGAVVKGTGRIHGVRLAAGDVVVGRTSVSAVERQRDHHPEAPRLTDT
ncbi:MAG: hypothetical protein ACTHMH_09355 [Curtobacterium sp.]